MIIVTIHIILAPVLKNRLSISQRRCLTAEHSPPFLLFISISELIKIANAVCD